MASHWVFRGFKFLVVFIVVSFLFGYVVLLLWNALIPELFHGPVITYWQAVGLLVLSHILLRGWGGGRHGNGWGKSRWRRRFEEKLSAMTPEERERFKEEWRRRCGWVPGEHPAGEGHTKDQGA